MIYLFTGTPGSGKSLHTARLIRDTLKWRKKPVVANFPINERTKGYERFTYRDNLRLTPDFLYSFARDYWGGQPVKEETILLVVDEAQLLFNSREWGQSDRMAWIEFLSQHRHFGYKIVLVAQYDRMIDRQIRALVEIEEKHRKMSNFGARGRIISLLALGEIFVIVKVFYGLNERVGVEYCRAHRSLFRLYDSYSVFRRTDGAEGAGRSGDPAPMTGSAPEDGEPAATAEKDRFPALRSRFSRVSSWVGSRFSILRDGI